MLTFRGWLACLRRWLKPHLFRLRTTLEILQERLRESVAGAVGGAVAGAVRDAVQGAFVAPPEYVAGPQSYHHPARPYWQEPDPDQPEYDSATEPGDYWWRDAGQEEYPAPVNSDPEPAPAHSRRLLRWCAAATLGCQAAGWWLRRQLGGAYPLLALAVGLAAGAGALTLGAGIADALLGLVGLADGVRAAAEVLSSSS